MERDHERGLIHATHLYPDGWFDNGGPVRTIRTGIEKRHTPGAAPGGGYDLAVRPPNRRTPPTAVVETLPLHVFVQAEAA
ncbi:DUF6349 family protein [Streptomyces sp. NPDC001514]